MNDIERTLLLKNEVFVYNLPPRSSARGYRAADWSLDQPAWTGRLRCVSKGTACTIRLEDKGSNELFAECPVEIYPGASVEAVTDSSRYFVLCVQDSGRKAYIGIGFTDRSDSFDLNVTLQDHFKQIKRDDQFSKEASEPEKLPNLDLAFKEGQTIRISIPNKGNAGPNANAAAKARPKGDGLLPPPPGGVKLPLPAAPGGTTQQPAVIPKSGGGGGGALADLLGDFSAPAPATVPSVPLTAPTTTAPTPAAPNNNASSLLDLDDWGDFAAPKAPTTQTVSSGNWEQF